MFEKERRTNKQNRKLDSKNEVVMGEGSISPGSNVVQNGYLRIRSQVEETHRNGLEVNPER